MTDYTESNWRLLRHIYSGWVELKSGRLQNIRLPPSHFQALTIAAKRKQLGQRPRIDDSLLHAIGNWLHSDEYGAWRNPNSNMLYKGNNKELWAEFCEASVDYPLQKAKLSL